MNALCSRSQAYLLLPQSELNFKLNCLINFKEVIGVMTAAEQKKSLSKTKRAPPILLFSLQLRCHQEGEGKRRSSISIELSGFCLPTDSNKQQYAEENKNQAKAERVVRACI